jgi:hypothetical protein
MRYAYGLLQLTPDQFWSMAWADFWDMLDGRVWWELRKQGVQEKRDLTNEQKAIETDWLNKKAEQLKLKGGSNGKIRD